MSQQRTHKAGLPSSSPIAQQAPPAWQFVLLSLLLHVWLIALFGDSGGGSSRLGDTSGGVATFAARLQVTEQSSDRTQTSPAARRPGPSVASTSTADTSAASEDQTRAETSLPPLPDIEKIPSLARESADEASALAPVSVAPIEVVPVAAATTSAEANDNRSVSTLVPLVAPLTVDPLALPKVDAAFTIAVPTITERVLVAPAAATRIDVAPLPSLPEVTPTSSAAAVATTSTLMIAPIVLPPVSTPIGGSNARASDVLPVAPLALRPLELPSAPVPASDTLMVPSLPVQSLDLPLSTRPLASVPSIDVPVAKPAPTTPSQAQDEVEQRSNLDATKSRQLDSSQSVAAETLRPVPQVDVSKASGSGPPALFNAPVLPPAPKTAPRTLDLDALRRQARDLSRDGAGARALLPFPALPKEVSKRDIEKAFDKALKRPDCNEAYRDMGLAAVIPLVRDALRDDGCRWQSPAPSQPDRATPPR